MSDPTMSQPMIKLNDVSFRYPHSGDAPAALEEVSLSIGRGESVAIAGGNGSGKTTLARLLNGLLLPTQGAVVIDGMSTRERKYIDTIRERVGLVFEDPGSQIVANSVEDDIAFGLENIGLPAGEIEKRIDAALAAFNLTGLRHREPHWLSGGQKQRTVLAGVMALEPEVLVLDEPTSMLDPRARDDLFRYLEELRESRRTIIHISHVMQELAGADRVVVLRSGRVEYDGTPRELFANGELLAAAGLLEPLPARLAKALAERGLDVPIPLTLEELVG